MKMLMVTPNYPPLVHGGGEISCQLLVKELMKHIEVDVLVGREMYPDMDMKRLLLKMYKAVDTYADGYDIVHTYNMDFLPIIGRLTLKGRIKSVATLNGIKYSNQMLDPSKKSFLRKHRNQLMMANAIQHINHCVTLCPMYRELWICDGISTRDISVIPNMLDRSFKASWKTHDGFNVLFVGNWAWWRDGQTLKSIADMDGVNLQIVGKGWDIDSVQMDYKDMKDVYSMADVLVAPYMFPLPISRCIIEAMQTGIPVVATGVDHLSPIIEHGVSGILVRDNRKMPMYINELMQDRLWAKHLGDNAKRRVWKVCDPGIIAHKYLEVYEKVMA